MRLAGETPPGARPNAAAAPEAREAGAERLRIAVVVPTVGRAATTGRTIGRLARQSRLPDRVVIVGSAPADVAGLDRSPVAAEVYLSTRGLCCQRNRSLGVIGADADLVIFFDDDFVAADDYLEQAERLFLREPGIVGATGCVIADGVNGPGLSFEEAEALLDADAASAPPQAPDRPRPALYGCNMVMRVAVIGAMKFDETLPLYGWQEDIDFSYRLGQRGRLVKSDALRGVHMGEKTARSPGVRLGYSQIANPIYLLRKSTIPHKLAWRVMRNNLMSNLLKSLWPESYIDRRGRLKGNVLAIRDLLTGAIHPRRIFAVK